MGHFIETAARVSLGLLAVAVLAGAGPALAADTPGAFFDSKAIDAVRAANKGALFHQDGRDYMVIAKTRTEPNTAESHAASADIVFFTGGSGVFVTGGTIVNAKTKSPGEVVGTAIEGGEEHQVGKGEVIVINPGTPHWFKSVNGKIEYMTVILEHQK